MNYCPQEHTGLRKKCKNMSLRCCDEEYSFRPGRVYKSGECQPSHGQDSLQLDRVNCKISSEAEVTIVPHLSRRRASCGGYICVTRNLSNLKNIKQSEK